MANDTRTIAMTAIVRRSHKRVGVSLRAVNGFIRSCFLSPGVVVRATNGERGQMLSGRKHPGISSVLGKLRKFVETKRQPQQRSFQSKNAVNSSSDRTMCGPSEPDRASSTDRSISEHDFQPLDETRKYTIILTAPRGCSLA